LATVRIIINKILVFLKVVFSLSEVEPIFIYRVMSLIPLKARDFPFQIINFREIAPSGFYLLEYNLITDERISLNKILDLAGVVSATLKYQTKVAA